MTTKFLKYYKILGFEIIFLVAFGAAVRAMDAGLSCPDWPLCFYKFIPNYHPQVYFEFIHRVLAGLVGIMTVVLHYFVLKEKTIPITNKIISIAILFLLAVMLS